MTITVNGLVQSVTSKTGIETTYAYDGLGRQTGATDPRRGTTTTAYYTDNAEGQKRKGRVEYVKDGDQRQTTYTYDANGRLFSVEDPAGKMQYSEYNDRGLLKRTWGETAYPVEYGYDAFGRRTSMKTYQGGDSVWNNSSWPAEPPAASETTWAFDPATGFLTSKTDAASKAVTYTYTPDGRMLTRKWARLKPDETPVTTTYTYYGSSDSLKTGELKTVSYDDGQTPSVTYSYNRLGRPSQITDALGTRLLRYNAQLQLDLEDVTTGLYTKKIMPQYDAFGRSAGLKIGPTEGSPYDYEVTYAYDDADTPRLGRFKGVSGPGLPAGGAVYGYVSNGDLVSSTSFKDGSGNTLASALRVYTADLASPNTDHRDLLASVENKAGSGLPLVSKYAYKYDAVGRRTSVVHTGTAFASDRLFKWGYNLRSELTTADRHEGTNPDSPGNRIAPSDYDYAYDAIGNRSTYRLDADPATAYTANALNQYAATTNPSEHLCYDADGNLVQDGKPTADCGTQDGTREYTWDAENRLILVAPASSPVEGNKKVEFVYDYLGRRVRKTVSTYTGGAWVEDTNGDQLFVYEGPALDTPGTGASQGWNVVLVLDANASNAITRKYTWGLDLSGLAGQSPERERAGGIHGAGGIGGLLGVEEPGGAHQGSYWFLYDGNGNVGQVIRASDQSIAARYEYDPYGNAIVATGAYPCALLDVRGMATGGGAGVYGQVVPDLPVQARKKAVAVATCAYLGVSECVGVARTVLEAVGGHSC